MTKQPPVTQLHNVHGRGTWDTVMTLEGGVDTLEPDALDLRHSALAPVDKATFRQALSQFASGVTVVTTAYEGSYHGITVSAFSSLSLDPPLVLVCIDRRGRSHELLAKAGVFAVNILSEERADLSQHFASRIEDKFANVDYHLGQTGVPLLDGALTTIECRLVNQWPGGDHSIFVGEVVGAAVHDEADALVYHRGRYRRLV
ncbi:MAG TPA: flavin reductase family protein [Herpetosiphonaceae bacterium]